NDEHQPLAVRRPLRVEAIKSSASQAAIHAPIEIDRRRDLCERYVQPGSAAIEICQVETIILWGSVVDGEVIRWHHATIAWLCPSGAKQTGAGRKLSIRANHIDRAFQPLNQACRNIKPEAKRPPFARF